MQNYYLYCLLHYVSMFRPLCHALSEPLIIGMTLCPKKIPQPIIEIPVIKASYYISIVLKMMKKVWVLHNYMYTISTHIDRCF